MSESKQKQLQEKYETEDVRLVSEAIKLTAEEETVLVYCKLGDFKPFLKQDDHNETAGSVKTSVSNAVFKRNGLARAVRSSAFEAHVMLQVPRSTVKDSVLVGVDDSEKKGTWHLTAEDKKHGPEILQPNFREEDLDAISRQLVLIWTKDQQDGTRWRLLANMGALHNFDGLAIEREVEGEAYYLFRNEEVVAESNLFSDMLDEMRGFGIYGQ